MKIAKRSPDRFIAKLEPSRLRNNGVCDVSERTTYIVSQGKRHVINICLTSFGKLALKAFGMRVDAKHVDPWRRELDLKSDLRDDISNEIENIEQLNERDIEAIIKKNVGMV